MNDRLPIANHPPSDDTILEQFDNGLECLTEDFSVDVINIIQHDEGDRRTLVQAVVSKWIDW